MTAHIKPPDDVTRQRPRYRTSPTLAPVTVIVITGETEDGDLLAAPARWEHDEGPPVILVSGVMGQAADRATRRMPVMGRGDRAVARVMPCRPANLPAPPGQPDYEAQIIRSIARDGSREETRQLGIFHQMRGHGGRLVPVVRGNRREITIAPGECGGARDGDLVLVETMPDPPAGRRRGRLRGRVLEVHGAVDSARAMSLIALRQHDIPDSFPEDALAEANRTKPPGMAGREDLCSLEFVTIDPRDARDHDDAVWAAADDDPANPDGWRVIVAIADVAAFVKPGSTLDREAARRGNSVYFPDRVVPMFPERLSTDLCSLKAHRRRPCLAVCMIFDARGVMKTHRFMRAIIKPAARLTYTQAQEAINGAPDTVTKPLVQTVLKPLWEAWTTLDKARQRRQPLDLDLPEYRVCLDDQGEPLEFEQRDRLDAHRLVEEFMIMANVAAAETLAQRKTPAIYRTHEAPAAEKLDDLSMFLQSLGFKLNRGATLMPAQFNRILAQAKDGPSLSLIGEIILRAQSQAVYSNGDAGHFGLNLRRYVHFTSPIRRYADLTIHRALIRALALGTDGHPAPEPEQLPEIADHISQTERRAMAAERDTLDRMRARWMVARIGNQYEGQITGVTRAGLFVRLAETGGDGLVPIGRLASDGFFRHDEARHALFDRNSGQVFQTGMTVTVRVAEAAPFSGGLRFDLVAGGRQESWARATGRRTRGAGGQNRFSRPRRRRPRRDG